MNNQIAIKVSGKPTFWGAYQEHKYQIAMAYGWNPDTATGYESTYRNIICPNLKNHDKIPINQYKMEDFLWACAEIKKKGYMKETGVISQYDEVTLERFLYLMRVVVETAAKNYQCTNVFEEDIPETASNAKRSKMGKIIPRSMPPEIERQALDKLLKNPMQSGENMGLLSMIAWGGRNGEACGANYGDIKLWRNIPGLWVIWVYKTTEPGQNSLQSAGKTRNADRVVLLPERYVQFIMVRKRQIQEILGPDVNVDELPIACRGDNYAERCSSSDLTIAAKDFFKSIGIIPEQLQLAYDEILQTLEDEKDPFRRMENFDLLEKEPTAYFLRRVYGTMLACVGLAEQDIAFQIGHDLGGPRELRNEFLNTEKLLEIKKLLDQRAILNAPRGIEPQELQINTTSMINGGGTHRIRIPDGATCVQIDATVCETLDELTVCISPTKDAHINMMCVDNALIPEKYRKSLDISTDYHNLYK